MDCETTGLDPIADRIIEIGVIKFDFNMVHEEFETLVNPEKEISETSIAIHHITEEMVLDKPTIADVLPQILNIIGRHTIIGHGIGFDIELLANAADRIGVTHTLKQNLTLDTLRLARLYGESPINSLEELRKHFNIQPEGAHRAMSDVMVNIDVFKNLCRPYKTASELFKILSKPIQMKIMPLGPHKGRPIKEVPLEYLYWAANKDFDQDLLYTIRSEINRRKKGNLFSQAANPFNFL